MSKIRMTDVILSNIITNTKANSTTNTNIATFTYSTTNVKNDSQKICKNGNQINQNKILSDNINTSSKTNTNISKSSDQILSDLTCRICGYLVNSPCKCRTCNKSYCIGCLKSLDPVTLKPSKYKVNDCCVVQQKHLKIDDSIMTILNGINIDCKTCNKAVSYWQYKEHYSFHEKSHLFKCN